MRSPDPGPDPPVPARQREERRQREDDTRMSQREPEAGADRRLSLAHQLAGRVVDDRDVVGVERVPGTERWSRGLLGVDAARGLALVGMMSVHLIPALDADGAVNWAYRISSGRASDRFAVLAGLSLVFINRPGGDAPPEPGARRGVMARGARGLPLGRRGEAQVVDSVRASLKGWTATGGSSRSRHLRRQPPRLPPVHDQSRGRPRPRKRARVMHQAAGEPASVIVQQTNGLDGCRPDPWPTPSADQSPRFLP